MRANFFWSRNVPEDSKSKYRGVFKDIYAEIEKDDMGKIHGCHTLWKIPSSYSSYSQDPALHYIPSFKNPTPIITKNANEITCRKCLKKLQEQTESFCITCGKPLYNEYGYKPPDVTHCKDAKCQIFKMILEYEQLKAKIAKAIADLKSNATT